MISINVTPQAPERKGDQQRGKGLLKGEHDEEEKAWMRVSLLPFSQRAATNELIGGLDEEVTNGTCCGFHLQTIR